MSFAGSTQMIFSSMQTCTIGSQGGPNKMAAANFIWLHFLNNRSSIQSFFFLRSVGNGPLVSQWSYDSGWRKKKSLISMKWKFT